jgi:hypothetical protein
MPREQMASGIDVGPATDWPELESRSSTGTNAEVQDMSARTRESYTIVLVAIDYGKVTMIMSICRCVQLHFFCTVCD